MLILVLILAQIAGQGVPPNVVTDFYHLDQRYEKGVYADTVTLKHKVLKVQFSKPRAEDSELIKPDKIQKFATWPRCSGVQVNEPQGPFTIENTSFEGMEIHGKPGMQIRFRCEFIAKREDPPGKK